MNTFSGPAFVLSYQLVNLARVLPIIANSGPELLFGKPVIDITQAFKILSYTLIIGNDFPHLYATPSYSGPVATYSLRKNNPRTASHLDGLFEKFPCHGRKFFSRFLGNRTSRRGHQDAMLS